MKKISFSILFFLFTLLSLAQNVGYKCYPTHWWAGMKWNKVQIMVHGDKIADNFPMIKMGPTGVKLATGVNLVKINRVENPNYIFLDLVIDATAKPGKFSFPFVNNIDLQYELKARRVGKGEDYAQGSTTKYFIYLQMPDPFNNGNPSNHKKPGKKDQSSI